MLLLRFRAFCVSTPASTSAAIALRAASRLRPVSRAADWMLTTGVPGSTASSSSAAEPARGLTRSSQDALSPATRSSKPAASAQASAHAPHQYAT